MNAQEYNLNIRPGYGYSQTVKVSQDDIGRPLEFHLYDGMDLLSITVGSVITIHATKPSGLGFTETCTWSGSTASISTTESMTQESGAFPAELVITSGDDVLGTANFTFCVERSPHQTGTTDGVAEDLQDIYEQLDDLKEDIGELSDLDTTVKTSVVEAINEVNTDVASYESDVSTYIKGINRFDGTNDGHYYVNQVTGKLASHSSSTVSKYINIENISNSIVISVSSVGVNNYTALRYALYTAPDENTFVRGGILTGVEDTVNSRYYNIIDVTNTKYVRFSLPNIYFSNASCKLMLTYGASSLPYVVYTADKWLIPDLLQYNSSVIGIKPQTVQADSLASGNQLKIDGSNSIKKNKILHFRANIDNTFSVVTCGIGTESYSLYWKIDGTNITFYSNGSSGSVLAHGLTMNTYFDFQVIIGNTNIGTIILNTLGGVYKKDVQIVQGYKGEIFLTPGEGTALTNALVSFACSDFRQPVWMFGDSYFTHLSDNRWTYWLITWGFDRCLLNGFPGAKSVDAIAQVQNYIANNGKPKYIAWCLGMNDPDNGSVNADWLNAVNTLITLCRVNGITPILSTIPNVPSYTHTYKNTWVKNSGYRYIDFAKAVGAENAGSSWYTGCLAQDGTHPAEPGARLLCLQALIDVPELLLGNI